MFMGIQANINDRLVIKNKLIRVFALEALDAIT